MKKELCVGLVIYKDYTEMHGQQDIKLPCEFLGAFAKLRNALHYVCPSIRQLVTTRLALEGIAMRFCIGEFNPVNAELNPICYLLALLGPHHFLHVSRIRVQSLTLRLLLSYIYIYIYIYGAPILDVSRSHTTTQHSR